MRVPAINYALCDVFAQGPFTGNPLAVFEVSAEIPNAMMQCLAREINYSEVSFLYPAQDGEPQAVRIFTALQEIPFAGHPVLGAAFVAAAARRTDRIVLRTGMGAISVIFTEISANSGFGWMNQPSPDLLKPTSDIELFQALGIRAAALPVESYWNGATHTMVALPTEKEVRALQPDMRALGKLQACVSCFAKSVPGWKTRVFSPYDGVPEDPATGSAAGPLAYHLARHGLINFGEEITIFQGEELNRPSKLLARVERGNEAATRVSVGGEIVRIGHGAIDGFQSGRT